MTVVISGVVQCGRVCRSFQHYMMGTWYLSEKVAKSFIAVVQHTKASEILKKKKISPHYSCYIRYVTKQTWYTEGRLLCEVLAKNKLCEVNK